jgi:hypothetical protein
MNNDIYDGELYSSQIPLSYIMAAICLILLFCSYNHGNPINTIVRDAANQLEGKVAIRGKDGRDYYVLQKHSDANRAAEIIAEINAFIVNFIIKLKKKYLYNERSCFSEDVYDPANEFVPYSSACAKSDPLNDYKTRAVYLLVSRYRPNRLEENQPTSKYDTSWAEGKGTRIALCIREQFTGKYNFIETDLIKFVAIHELTHIAANTLQHPYYFWKVFKFLLLEAEQLMGFKPVNFATHPTNYCSMPVSYNPVYDHTINVQTNESRDIKGL